jgi:hypothetical protein
MNSGIPLLTLVNTCGWSFGHSIDIYNSGINRDVQELHVECWIRMELRGRNSWRYLVFEVNSRSGYSGIGG